MQKQEKEDEEQMAQQEAADQKLQAKQDTHTAANRQQQAEVHLNLHDAAFVPHFCRCWTLSVAGDECCIQHPEHVASADALLYKPTRDAYLFVEACNG